jgi:acetyl-CoA carboxylase biotin carboxyl carrier protein
MARIEIESDVTGTVWKIEVEEGAKVTEGQTLIILESMKMESPVLASDDGTVAEIMVAEEEPVSEGQVVVVLDV